jgi:hypothetical protein
LRYSLLRRNPDARTYTIHRLLQVVLKENIPLDQQPYWVQQTVAILSAWPLSFDETKRSRGQIKEQRSLAQLYLSHVKTCAIHIKMGKLRSAEAGELLNRAGAYEYQRQEYEEAQQFYEQ